MSFLNDLTDILTQVKVHHPNFKFTWMFKDDILTIGFEHETIDSMNPSQKTSIHTKALIKLDKLREERDPQQALLYLVHKKWLDFWIHEANEWFSFKGKLHKDPHSDATGNQSAHSAAL